MLEIIDIALGTSHCRVNLKSDDGMKIAEIPENLAAELGLVEGLIISEKEWEDIQEGKVPENWDSLENRHDYVTDIGKVCMAGTEYREYMERNSE